MGKVHRTMQIDHINLPSRLFQELDFSSLKLGQRLQVEIISNEKNQEGFISLNGNLVKAKLEVPAQAGDRFWAAVIELGDNGIVLSREKINNLKNTGLSPEQVFTLLNRGFSLDPKISELLTKFVTNSQNAWLAILASNSPQLAGLLSKLWKFIPQWLDVSRDPVNYLEKYFAYLGLGYEKMILENYKSGQEERQADQSTLKALLMQILSGKGDSLSAEDGAVVQRLLDEITGQQLWIQSGIKDSAYCLMHFPFQDNGVIYYCKLAIESSRKGGKLDLDHCHLSLQVETPNLGLIGADLIIYEKNINISILHNEIEELRSLVQILAAEAEKGFAMIGYTLQTLSMKSFNDFPQFSAFLTGKSLSGVDVKG